PISVNARSVSAPLHVRPELVLVVGAPATAAAQAERGASHGRQSRLVQDPTGLPAVIRPSFSLGGSGSGIAYNKDEFEEIVERGLDLSPVHEILVEESVLGWKEYELEVMRDHADNFVVICSIENFDPMGIHTG